VFPIIFSVYVLIDKLNKNNKLNKQRTKRNIIEMLIKNSELYTMKYIFDNKVI